MKKNDFIWAGILVLFGVFLSVKETREIFESATRNYPYLMGFLKVGVLASMGELLSIRIAEGTFKKPCGFGIRVFVWGLFGVTFTLVFKVFGGGVVYAIEKGLLPNFSEGVGRTLFIAFATSALMNLVFAPTFMALHRILDTFIDLGNGSFSRIKNVKLKEVCEHVDWNGYVGFVVLKTIPFFWIPAHTVTFMLPEEYRVLMAAVLSIALGAILAYSKRRVVP